jgi:hypothetical protein
METTRVDQEFVVEWQLRPARDRDVVIDLTSEHDHQEDFAVVTGTPPFRQLRQGGTRHSARRSQPCWS